MTDNEPTREQIEKAIGIFYDDRYNGVPWLNAGNVLIAAYRASEAALAAEKKASGEAEVRATEAGIKSRLHEVFGELDLAKERAEIAEKRLAVAVDALDEIGKGNELLREVRLALMALSEILEGKS